MTIRTTRTGVLGAFLLTLLALFLAPPAQAGDPLTEKSAGRKYALESKAATAKAGESICVTAEINDAGNQAGKLRARKSCESLGSWETFTLHTNDKGSRAALRSEANGLYVSAEFHDAGSHKGMLRARQAGSIGNWERFELKHHEGGWYSLTYNFTEGGSSENYYVSAEINSTGSDEGLLRARASAKNAPGSWELFKLRQISSPSEPPTPTFPTPARDINVLTWNACGNNDSCDMYEYSVNEFTEAIATQAQRASAGVILLQEFCEKLAKPLEHKLEDRLNSGADAWDVRFAPIQYAIGKSGRWAQKSCAKNRGAYGVAIAVPAENTWYKAVELNSPEKTERRTALCAAVQSWAVMACTAHFSTGGKGYDDPERHVQQAQAAHLAEKVAEYPGYRPVFGGDLNATPTVTPEESTVPVLQPLYQKFKECDPTNTVTAGNSKLDYLFAPNTATWAPCHVGGSVGPSDHKPVWGTVTLPAR
ncbi:endonuclease/exonuclease/phosphatase family protein [Streptomyces bacillaris]|uniref:endonuclease/exonuclease/phosphatase family protein n=1 Tax=Streptomyces bacillaris TaxID=68179 RepID=UPI0038279F9C